MAVEATYRLLKSAIVRLLIVSVYTAYAIVKLVMEIRLILSVSIYKTYAYVILYILVAYAVMLWRRSYSATVIMDMLRVCMGYVLITNYHYLIWPLFSAYVRHMHCHKLGYL